MPLTASKGRLMKSLFWTPFKNWQCWTTLHFVIFLPQRSQSPQRFAFSVTSVVEMCYLGLSSVLFCLLLMFQPLFSIEQTITINSEFTVTIPLENLPQEARPALFSYLDMIKVSRPLPEPYLLESYTIHNNTLELKGRFLQEGDQDLYLGTFVWGKVIFSFPHLSLSVKPSSLISLTPHNILLPFPQFSYTISQGNLIAQKELFQTSTADADTLLHDQKKLYYSLLSIFLLTIMFPFLRIFVKGNLFLQKQVKQEISIHDELERIRQQKTAQWEALLILLRRISQEGPDITAYELERHFSQKGEPNLAHASSLIEQYGYRNEPNLEKFSEAILSLDEEPELFRNQI